MFESSRRRESRRAWAVLLFLGLGGIAMVYLDRASRPERSRRGRRPAAEVRQGRESPQGKHSGQPVYDTVEKRGNVPQNTLRISDVPAVGERPATPERYDDAVAADGMASNKAVGAAAKSNYAGTLGAATYNAPSAGGSAGSSAASFAPPGASNTGQTGEAPLSREPDRAPEKAAPKDPKEAAKARMRSLDAGASSLGADSRLAGAVAKTVVDAQNLKIAGSSMSPKEILRREVANSIMEENKTNEAVRNRIEALGPGAGVEAQRTAAAAALAAQGKPVTEHAITNAVAAATTPPGSMPQPTPEGMDRALQEAVRPPEGQPQPPPGPPYVPPGPPPGNWRAMYCQHKAAFEAAKAQGIDPHDILALLQQESGYCANTGRRPLLEAVANRKPDRDAAVWMRSLDPPWLPAPLENLRGSRTGAQGCGQFQPATSKWIQGGDPYDRNRLISHAMPKLMRINGYRAGNEQAIRRAHGRYFGDSQPYGDYANSVWGIAQGIKAQMAGFNCP